MSQETSNWLNTNTLVGFTEKRGKAWHYREGADNHFEGAIPAEVVKSRLFGWEGLEAPVEYRVNGKAFKAPDRKVIYRSDTGADLGVFKCGYVVHQYQPWLMSNVETVADTDLEIGSAGLLRGGGQAWVQFELPETIQAAEGVEFRPFISAATSMDGTIATTYMTGAQVIVCDNTLSAALVGADGKFKVRHSKRSLSRVGEARDALGLVYAAGPASVAPASSPSAAPVSTSAAPEVPAEYRAALEKATSYANDQAFSKAALYAQLTSKYGEQFPKAAATYAIDHVQADWNANALTKAKSYRDDQAMSTASIRQQLTSKYGEQFTAAQADYAIKHLND